MIYETECSMETSGTDDSGSANTEAGCNLFCTGLGVGDLVTYMQYGVREEECTCYFSGKRKCDNVIMAQGITFADYEKCGGSNPDVPTPPPVECTSDNDCNDPSKPLCDLPTNVCKAGCKEHENCADIEYCDCDEGSECPGGSVGSCLPGCRDLGSSCTMATGASGECQEHVCTPSGKPKIKKITSTTLSQLTLAQHQSWTTLQQLTFKSGNLQSLKETALGQMTGVASCMKPSQSRVW